MNINETMYGKFREITEFLGTENMLDEIVAQMSDLEFNSAIKYIGEMHGFDMDLEFNNEDEEE